MTLTALKRKRLHWKDLNKHWIAEAHDYIADLTDSGNVIFYDTYPSLALIRTAEPIRREELASFFIFDGDLAGEYTAHTIIDVPNDVAIQSVFFWIDCLVERMESDSKTPHRWKDVVVELRH